MEESDAEIVICELWKCNLMREILGALVGVPLSNDKGEGGPMASFHFCAPQNISLLFYHS
jgi:hypothetical protein